MDYVEEQIYPGESVEPPLLVRISGRELVVAELRVSRRHSQRPRHERRNRRSSAKKQYWPPMNADERG